MFLHCYIMWNAVSSIQFLRYWICILHRCAGSYCS